MTARILPLRSVHATNKKRPPSVSPYGTIPFLASDHVEVHIQRIVVHDLLEFKRRYSKGSQMPNILYTLSTHPANSRRTRRDP